MAGELAGQLLRQWRNVSNFRAFSPVELARTCLTFPIDYYLRDGRAAPPLSLSFLVTFRCNAGCGMCNVRGFRDVDLFRNEMSVQSIRRAAAGWARLTKNIVLSGGEPFLRDDFVELVGALRAEDFRVGLFTNGLRIDGHVLDELIALELQFVAFSLEGPEEVHDRVLGIPGAYSKLIENMEYLCRRRRATKVVIHSTISDANLDHLEDITMIGRRLGVDAVRFGHLSYLTEAEAASNSRRLGVETNRYPPRVTTNERDYPDRIRALRRKYPAVTFAPELSDAEVGGWYGREFRSNRKCHFLWRNLFIFPNGDVYPCLNQCMKMGNALQGSLDEIWNSDPYVSLRRRVRRELLPGCHRCCKL